MNVITQMDKRIKLNFSVCSNENKMSLCRLQWSLCEKIKTEFLQINAFLSKPTWTFRNRDTILACYPCGGFVSEQLPDDVSWLPFRLNEFDRCCAELEAGSRKDSPVLGDCWPSGSIFSTCGADLGSVSRAFAFNATPILQEAWANSVIILKTGRTCLKGFLEKSKEEAMVVTSCSGLFVFAWAM